MKKYKLGDILELQRGYDLPHSEMEEGNVPVAGSSGIIGYHSISKIDPPCITIGRSGSVGKLFFYNEAIWPHNTSLYIKSFKNNNEKYIFYLLKTVDFERLCDSSVVPSLNRNFVYPIKVPFYDNIADQQKIAAVLSSLDDKIALNNRINAKLEQMAKRLYDYWFVQFDFPVPCHSELVSESHNKEMLNQVQHDECAKPYKSTGGKMVWNEELKREIPAGWEVKKLGEIALVKRGTTITEKDTTKGNVKVVAGGLDFSYYHNQSNRKANCITVSGSGENAGFVNFWREPIFASDCSTAQCENDIDTMLCYFALKMQEKRFYRISHKSAQPHIYPKDVAEIPIVVPNEAVKSKISDFFLKSNWKIALIEKETQKLTALRDRLLPLLMNGQVEVK